MPEVELQTYTTSALTYRFSSFPSAPQLVPSLYKPSCARITVKSSRNYYFIRCIGYLVKELPSLNQS